MAEPKRILIVDDEEHNRDLLQAILEASGYVCETARDGREALNILRPDIDLVLLDVMMPGMDGFQVTRMIREDPVCGDIPIIIVTVLADKEDRLKAVKAGASDFVSKPIDKLELTVRMSSLLKMKEAQDAIKRHRAELEVTVEKRTADLRDSEARYRGLFEASLDAIVLTGPQLELVDANKAFLDMFGYTAADLNQLTLEKLFADPEERTRFRDALSQQGFVRDFELIMVGRTGEERVCIVTSSAGPADRDVVGHQSIIRDITDRKRAERALRESEERLRLLIEASPVGIMIAQHGMYTYVNPAFVAMFGCEDATDLVGQPIGSVLAPEDRQLFTERVLSYVTSDGGPSSYHQLKGQRRPEGTVDLAVWLTSFAHGGTPALLGFFVDVSEERALKALLLQAQKMEALGTLAGGIAHDFNNILYAIIGYTELTLDEMPPGSKAHSNLGQVLVAAHRAKDVVTQILAFSRQGEEERKPVDISPIVKETIKFMRASIPATIQIRRNVAGDVGTVMADPTQIHQVLMNLCTNAAHSMREIGGELVVSLSQVCQEEGITVACGDIVPGSHLRLAVSDTGTGMPPEVVERIFEPYFTTKKAGEGTGLGLSVVHGIVRSHGGDIVVHSEPGKGTTFEVFLPLIQEEVEQEVEDTEDLPTGHERVLLVDDEQALALMGKQMLESVGYTVETRTSSVEALELFRMKPGHFDLVVTDLTMPNLTGRELAREIKALRPDMPIVLCTGFSELVTEERAQALGIAALITKPVLKSKLARTVRTALDAQSANEVGRVV